MNDPRLELIDSASHFYQMGWMVGTAGNLSAKLSDGTFWITASGKSKGKLQLADFVRINSQGEMIESAFLGNRPSFETSIHKVIYSLFPEAQACFHVHSVEANLVSRLTREDNLKLPAIEMLKGLGIWEENPEVTLPLFENYLNVPQIAQSICQRFEVSLPQVPALLIKDHGVTVWGNSIEATFNYLEVIEYIFRYILLKP
jgi:methylthioribulose-1-phosphate dehydratase